MTSKQLIARACKPKVGDVMQLHAMTSTVTAVDGDHIELERRKVELWGKSDYKDAVKRGFRDGATFKPAK